jgi:hypothetical protein
MQIIRTERRRGRVVVAISRWWSWNSRHRSLSGPLAPLDDSHARKVAVSREEPSLHRLPKSVSRARGRAARNAPEAPGGPDRAP